MAATAPDVGRLPARELINLIHQLAADPDTALGRKLRGPMAAWDMQSLLLRNISFQLAGANWQRGGGKGQKPKPIELPDGKGRGAKPVTSKPAGADVAQRLANLGLIPPGATGTPISD